MWSKYFTPSELISSATAQQRGISNTPSWSQLAYMAMFCRCCLDEIRDIAARPVIVTSGYRSADLNKAVGGVKNSHHLYNGSYAAADITLGNVVSNCKLFDKIAASDVPFVQLIREDGGRWIHVSWHPFRCPREVICR